MKYLARFPTNKKAVWALGPNMKAAGVTVVCGEDEYRVLVVELPPIRMTDSGMSPVVPHAIDVRGFRESFFDDEADVWQYVPAPDKAVNRIILWQKLTGPAFPASGGLPRPPRVTTE